jgi:subtilisin family serine protease
MKIHIDVSFFDKRTPPPESTNTPQKLSSRIAIIAMTLLAIAGLSMGQEKRENAREHRPGYILRGKSLSRLQIVQNSFSSNIGSADMAQTAAQSSDGIEPLSGRVLISFQEGIRDSEKQEILAGISPYLRMDPETASPHFNVAYIEQEDLAVRDVVSRLKEDPRVRVAEPDYKVYALETIPNDPSFLNLWALRNTGQGAYGSSSCTTCSKPGADISASEAWDLGTGSADVIVAVIDSGVDYTHPDLAANILRDGSNKVIGYDFANNDDNPMDDLGHGTHCAGIIGAVGNNGIGIAGVNWKVKIMPLKFLSSGGSGSTSGAVLAIDFAVANGATILSNSWGGGGNSELLLEAIRRAERAGVLFVAAAGNSAANIDSGGAYPAAYSRTVSNVVAVAATDSYDQLSYFSNYGPKACDIAAPGESIYSTVPSGSCPYCTPSGYASMSGTSMAAPHVAGAAALIKSRFPQLSLTGLKARLLYSADRPVEMDGYTRWGRLNVFAAMQDDTVPPAGLSNFVVTKASGTGLRLSWTASGDNETVGRVSAYQVFYNTDPDLVTATMIEPGIRPGAFGTEESFDLTGLTPDTVFYVFLRALDKVGNASPVAIAGPVKTGSVGYSDGAEGNSIFTTINGAAWSTTSEDSRSGRWSYVSPVYTSGVQISTVRMINPVYVSGPMYLTFWMKRDLADSDFILPIISDQNTGISTTLLNYYNGSSPWTRYRVDLSGYAGHYVKFGFTLYSGAGSSAPGVLHRVWVDDLSFVTLVKGWEDNVEGISTFSGFSPWSITNESSYSPTHAWSDSPYANYKQNARSPLMQTTSVVLPDSLGALSLVFRSKLDLEEDRDYLEIYGSQDDGASWEYISALTGKSDWAAHSFELPGWKKARFLFFLITNEAVARDGVYLDDIGIWGESFGPAASAAVSEVDLDLSSGGIDSTFSLGPFGNLAAGYATVSAGTGNGTYGTAVYSYTKDGIVQFEAGVPTTPPTRAARFFVDLRSSNGPDSPVDVSTGLAVANIGSSPANLALTLRGLNGDLLKQGSVSLQPGEHLAKMLYELAPGFALPADFDGMGTLEITSDRPVSIFASRLTLNQAGNFLVSNSPVADLSAAPSSGTLFFPQVADGGGYQTTFILMNTSSTQESGMLSFFENNGAPLAVRMQGGTAASSGYPYSIAPGGFLRLVTDGSPVNIGVGWARLSPQSGSSIPAAAALLALTQDGVLITEAGYPAVAPTSHARIYVDMSRGHDTGVAICNPGSSAIHVKAAAFRSDGTSPAGNGSGYFDLAAGGHDAQFAGGLIPGLPDDFVGVLDLSASLPFSAMTVRSLISGDNFLMTVFPVADLNISPPSPVVFPQIADGEGYQTQILLLSSGGPASKVTVRYYGEHGEPLNIGR